MDDLKEQFEVLEEEKLRLVKSSQIKAKEACQEFIKGFITVLGINLESSFEMDQKGPLFRVVLNIEGRPTIVKKTDWFDGVQIVCMDNGRFKLVARLVKVIAELMEACGE